MDTARRGAAGQLLIHRHRPTAAASSRVRSPGPAYAYASPRLVSSRLAFTPRRSNRAPSFRRGAYRSRSLRFSFFASPSSSRLSPSSSPLGRGRHAVGVARVRRAALPTLPPSHRASPTRCPSISLSLSLTLSSFFYRVFPFRFPSRRRSTRAPDLIS